MITPVHEFHTPEDLVAMAKWLKPAPSLELHIFEEKETVIQKGYHGYTREELNKIKKELEVYIPNVKIR